MILLTPLQNSSRIAKKRRCFRMVISERVAIFPQQEGVTPQSYAQEMTNIWQRVNAIQQGEENSPQRNATNFDLWKLSETVTPVTPDNYPSLAGHGLLKATQGEDGIKWQPAFVHLEDFWAIGVQRSEIYGFRCVPQEDFQKRLEERLGVMFSGEEAAS